MKNSFFIRLRDRLEEGRSEESIIEEFYYR